LTSNLDTLVRPYHLYQFGTKIAALICRKKSTLFRNCSSRYYFCLN